MVTTENFQYGRRSKNIWNFFFGLLRNKIVSFELSKVNVLNNELKLFKECYSLVNLFGTGV